MTSCSKIKDAYKLDCNYCLESSALPKQVPAANCSARFPNWDSGKELEEEILSLFRMLPNRNEDSNHIAPTEASKIVPTKKFLQSAPLFNQDVVRSVDIAINASQWAYIVEMPAREQYVRANVRISGPENFPVVRDVGFRAKGSAAKPNPYPNP